MDITINGFTFISNFESGNLAHVEVCSPSVSLCKKSLKSFDIHAIEQLDTEVEFHLWTKPDCVGTEFENNNRTWFYFGIQGGCKGQKVKLAVMNLNKQLKLYSQGMQPVMCYGNKYGRLTSWERIKEKCAYKSEENNTVISWSHIVCDLNVYTYYAFTYPFTYSDLQNMLKSLEQKTNHVGSLYFHRELLTLSLDGNRLDLLTISSTKGQLQEREAQLPGLFPDLQKERSYKFVNKKVVFVSARVHPGETPSSFVFNGFIHFIISNDRRAVALRDLYVFKLVPMLNPDGVIRGHYRTDQLGVNLNRVYINPSAVTQPTIFAVKSIILYYHNDTILEGRNDGVGISDGKARAKIPVSALIDEDTCHSFSDVKQKSLFCSLKNAAVMEVDEPSASGWDVSSNASLDSVNFQKLLEVPEIHDDCSNVSSISEAETGITSMFNLLDATQDLSCSPSKTSFSNLLQSKQSCFGVASKCEGAFTSKESFSFSEDCASLKCQKEELNKDIKRVRYESFGKSQFSSLMPKPLPQRKECLKGAFSSALKLQHCDVCQNYPELPSSSESEPENGLKLTEKAKIISKISCPVLSQTFIDSVPLIDIKKDDENSGLFMYIDLHGHASKRGIFIYGNWFEDFDLMVENMLFPKLMEINCSNFEFSACNFSEKNMYIKDRQNGMSKEGSGRVAIMRSTGLLRSYTLECNYNSGRMSNSANSSTQDKKGYSPPKYTPVIFEDCGLQLAVSLLDLAEKSDEPSKLHQSSFSNLNEVRSWIYQFVSASPSSLSNFATPRLQTMHNSRNLTTKTGKGVLDTLKVSPRPWKSISNPSHMILSKVTPTSVPASPKPRRTKGQKVRRNSWCQAVDSENQEPQEIPGSSRSSLIKNTVSHKHKVHLAKLKPTSPKKSVILPLNFSEIGGCNMTIISSENKVSSKLSSNQQNLNANVSLTPNLNIKMSISEAPACHSRVKKLDKIRRQKSKSLIISKKANRFHAGSSVESSPCPNKAESLFGLPCVDGEAMGPLSPVCDTLYSSSHSPRSPLSSLCDPQTSNSASMLSHCDSRVCSKTQPLKKGMASSKRSGKNTLKPLSKSMEGLPAITPSRIRLIQKKTRKKFTETGLDELSSHSSLDWILCEPPRIEVVAPKTKKRKKKRKSL